MGSAVTAEVVVADGCAGCPARIPSANACHLDDEERGCAEGPEPPKWCMLREGPVYAYWITVRLAGPSPEDDEYRTVEP